MWDRQGLPFSPTYDDIYFSVNDPVAESRHVFIEGSHLPERMAAGGDRPLTVCECGFGFGLNFLLTAEHFCRLAPRGHRLHYISCELHPVRHKDLQRFFAMLPSDLLALSAALLSHYPEQGKGLHRLQFSYRHRFITLDLVYDDAASALGALSMPAPGVDAWYLDGFTPTRNEAMWQARLFREIAARSHAGTTLASYSVAGEVRRSLEAVGFSTEKTPGYGNKRHKLFGRFVPAPGSGFRERDTWTSPWPQHPEPIATVAVIGAGLAGCATAHALASRGIAVTLVEKAGQLAGGSSGNPRGLVHFNPARKMAPAARFRLQAFTHAVRHYGILSGSNDIGWRQSGVLQLAASASEKALQKDLLAGRLYDRKLMKGVSAEEASGIAGMPLEHGGLYLPLAGSINPAALCRVWAGHDNIRQLLHTEVLDFIPSGGQWRLRLADDAGPANEVYDAVVVCHNAPATDFSALPAYPCQANHGQVDAFVLDETGHQPAVPLCHRGYVIPWQQHGKPMVMIGGSYAQGGHGIADTQALSRKNLTLLGQIAPALKEYLATRSGSGANRQGSRLTTPDYQPLAGPVEDAAACRELFAGYARNARKAVRARPEYVNGLYVNLAHGSGGLTSTPLLAEYLASLICGESLPLLEDDIPAVHPLRFLLRDLKKQRA